MRIKWASLFLITLLILSACESIPPAQKFTIANNFTQMQIIDIPLKGIDMPPYIATNTGLYSGYFILTPNAKVERYGGGTIKQDLDSKQTNYFNTKFSTDYLKKIAGELNVDYESLRNVTYKVTADDVFVIKAEPIDITFSKDPSSINFIRENKNFRLANEVIGAKKLNISATSLANKAFKMAIEAGIKKLYSNANITVSSDSENSVAFSVDGSNLIFAYRPLQYDLSIISSERNKDFEVFVEDGGRFINVKEMNLGYDNIDSINLTPLLNSSGAYQVTVTTSSGGLERAVLTEGQNHIFSIDNKTFLNFILKSNYSTKGDKKVKAIFSMYIFYLRLL